MSESLPALEAVLRLDNLFQLYGLSDGDLKTDQTADLRNLPDLLVDQTTYALIQFARESKPVGHDPNLPVPVGRDLSLGVLGFPAGYACDAMRSFIREQQLEFAHLPHALRWMVAATRERIFSGTAYIYNPEGDRHGMALETMGDSFTASLPAVPPWKKTPPTPYNLIVAKPD